MEFAKTPMGRKYYDKDLPALIESNNRMAKAQEEANSLSEKRIRQNERLMQLKHRKLLVEMKAAGLSLQDLILESRKDK